MALLISKSRLFLTPSFGSFVTGHHYSTASNEDVEVPANVPQPVLSSKNVAQFRKGTGGRASFSGNVVTVFGNSGFAGAGVVNRLAKQGCQMIIPYRCDPYFVKEHKVVGELGQILFFPFNLKDETSIRKAVKYSNVVINLIGTFLHTPNFSPHDTNVEGARRIARICREMGVERLVHVSAMGADPDHKSRYIKNGHFLRTKGLGELAVRDEFPNATIVRPSVMYGECDHFLFPYTSFTRRCPIFGFVYIYKGGKGIYKMPVYVNDFALGIARIATDPAMAGKTFELVGPHCYEMCELVDYIYRKAGCRREILYYYHRLSWPDPWFWIASTVQRVRNKLHKSTDVFYDREWNDFLEATSDVLTGGNTLGFKDLGIKPKEFEQMGGWFCDQRSFAGKEELDYGELSDPPLPLRSPPLYKHKPKAIKLEKTIHTEQKAFGFGRKLAETGTGQ